MSPCVPGALGPGDPLGFPGDPLGTPGDAQGIPWACEAGRVLYRKIEICIFKANGELHFDEKYCATSLGIQGPLGTQGPPGDPGVLGYLGG